ncbi:response regulator transcription factor [Clostridium sardiniense]|uniref:response regulator transcription factor n=1 Tax=Clostridium sardiniense TaxID=29369 RepID=UPI003D347EA5
MINILVVDDDKNIRTLLNEVLKRENYTVILCSNGQEALDAIENNQISIAIVDIMMPLVDGLEVTKHIKEILDIPVLLLTAKGELNDKIDGFNKGADDYLVKPFEVPELLLRIKALLRRYKKISKDIISYCDLLINFKECSVKINNTLIDFPLKEFQLLFKLSSFPNKVFTRNELIEDIWGIDYEGDDRTVDVHIKRIREKLVSNDSSAKITTIRGLGYKIEGD